MRPELERFFALMDRAFAEPRALPAVHASVSGWPASVERLSIYGRFVEGHIRSTLRKVYPITAAQLGEQFEGLAEGYYRTRPARHFEMNHAAEGFCAFLADRSAELQLPPHLVPAARFEWADFAVYASEVVLPQRVDAPVLNPTLTVLQHPFQLCAWFAAAPEERGPAPLPGDETALLWRDPGNLRTSYVAADARRLLAVKLLVEGTPIEQVAAEAGAPVRVLEAALVQAADEGFVLAPAQR